MSSAMQHLHRGLTFLIPCNAVGVFARKIWARFLIVKTKCCFYDNRDMLLDKFPLNSNMLVL